MSCCPCKMWRLLKQNCSMPGSCLHSNKDNYNFLVTQHPHDSDRVIRLLHSLLHDKTSGDIWDRLADVDWCCLSCSAHLASGMSVAFQSPVYPPLLPVTVAPALCASWIWVSFPLSINVPAGVMMPFLPITSRRFVSCVMSGIPLIANEDKV